MIFIYIFKKMFNCRLRLIIEIFDIKIRIFSLSSFENQISI